MKKTKKQKLLAQLHRIKQSTTPIETNYQIPVTTPGAMHQSPITKSVSFTQQPTSIKTTVSSDANYSFVSRDLRQTVVLTGLAIAAQLCLYYFLVVKHLV